MWFADTSLAVFLVCFVSLAVATPNTTSATQPVIVLDKAKVIGKANGTVTQFLGIPYAKPPYVCPPLRSACRLLVLQNWIASAPSPRGY